MIIEVESINNGAIIRITGEVDLSVSPEMKEMVNIYYEKIKEQEK